MLRTITSPSSRPDWNTSAVSPRWTCQTTGWRSSPLTSGKCDTSGTSTCPVTSCPQCQTSSVCFTGPCTSFESPATSFSNFRQSSVFSGACRSWMRPATNLSGFRRTSTRWRHYGWSTCLEISWSTSERLSDFVLAKSWTCRTTRYPSCPMTWSQRNPLCHWTFLVTAWLACRTVWVIFARWSISERQATSSASCHGRSGSLNCW